MSAVLPRTERTETTRRGEAGAGSAPARDESFPRAARLTRPSDFKRVFTRPVVSADRYFKVLARRRDSGIARLGLAVSRNVDKRASARNRLKRITRESFRRHFAGGGTGLDIVVLPRRESIGTRSASLLDSLEKHWERLEARTRNAVADGGPDQNTPGEERKA